MKNNEENIPVKGSLNVPVNAIISVFSEDHNKGDITVTDILKISLGASGNVVEQKVLKDFKTHNDVKGNSYVTSVFHNDLLLSVTPSNAFPSFIDLDFEVPDTFALDEPPVLSRLTGYITSCNRPAGGLTVRAYATRQFGIEIEGRCRPGTTATRSLGSVETASDGSFEIRFTPTHVIQGTCFFRRELYIEVYDGDTRVWRSQHINEQINNVIDGEIFAGCSENSTLIRVLNENGSRAENAEVYVNGVFKGRTDDNGQLAVPNVRLGSLVAARKLMKENKTNRSNHQHESDQNWNYRAYQTSITVIHDANGDNVVLPQHLVGSNNEVQVIRLRSGNALIGLNLLFSIEWDATAEELLYYSDRIKELSELLYNATDGQFLIEHFVIADDKQSWNDADVRIYSSLKQSSYANVDGFSTTGCYTHMNPRDAFIPGAILHEFGHYIFGMLDEYNNNQTCTVAARSNIGPPEFFDGGVKDSCLMRGPNFFSSLKFCSNHPDNPHVTGNYQGDHPCWDNIMNRFNGFPLWRLHSPETRNAIVTKFPDSGVNMMLLTPAPDLILAPVQSHIPVLGWKPRYHFENEHRDNECRNLKVTVFYNGAKINDARVGLNTPSRSMYMGWSGPRPYLNFRDPSTGEYKVFSTSDGECIIRGAHEGDTITAYKDLEDGTWLLGTIRINAHGSGMNLFINTERMSFGIGEIPEVNPVSVAELAIRNIAANTVSATSPQSLKGEYEGALSSAKMYFDKSKSHLTVFTDQMNEIRLSKTIWGENNAAFEIPVHANALAVNFAEKVILHSPDGCLMLMVATGSLQAPDQLVIHELNTLPAPLPPNKSLVAGPYRCVALKTTKLNPPAEVQFFLSYTPEKAGAPPEVMHFDEKKKCWVTIKSTHSDFPRAVFCEMEKTGMYILISS